METKRNFLLAEIPNFERLLKLMPTQDNVLASPRHRFDELFIPDSRNRLIANRTLVEKLYSDFMPLSRHGKRLLRLNGAYVFWEETTPLYVGISRSVLNRLKQHVIGVDHNQASLAYQIALTKRDSVKKAPNRVARAKFPFENYRKDIQTFMRERWRISIIPASDEYELYLLELYLSCLLKSYGNSFRTH